MTFKDFEDFLLSEKCFKSHDVSIIREGGLQDQIDTLHYWDYQSQMAKHLAEEKVTIKVEQMERHWKFDDRTIHLFYNPKSGPTFDEHTDPVDVIIEVKAGSKTALDEVMARLNWEDDNEKKYKVSVEIAEHEIGRKVST